MKRTINKYYIFLILLAVITACSTKKNTSLSRGYHNLTSRYNVLFNGWESYKKGMIRMEEIHEDDFNKILPLFIYHSKEEVSSIGSEMDRSIQKGTKLISKHSITVKPELKDDKDLTESQREFYNKNEYNKWVDDAYLLIGKAHFYKHDFDNANETFRFIVSNYPDVEPQYEARIWLARLSIERERFKEAENTLNELEAEDDFPKQLKADLEATKAALEIGREDYTQAIESLAKAVELEKSKYYRQRYYYVLAQLYQETNNRFKAADNYRKVIRLNPPYDMTFNARINMALNYEAGTISRKEIEKQLQKMLKDDKNIEYQDQIYFAWGNLYFQEGNVEEAVRYYELSSSVSVGNNQQKALTFLTIADIYYDMPKYVPAQAYYDSAVSVIDAGYPNYNVIYAKSLSLTNLVASIETVQLEDSVQKLAYLPQPELNALIDKIINNEKEREEAERERKLEESFNASFETQQHFEIQTAQKSWYFYNKTAVDLGRKEFKRKWGARKLEDNWRRIVKTVIDPGTTYTEAGEFGEIQEGQKQEGKAISKYTRGYYLSDIPFTDSAFEVSHLRIQKALLNMGDIYNQELKDYEKASRSYEELLSRYPTYEGRLQVYYKLYIIGKLTQNIDVVSLYQQKIIKEFPESTYALVLSDPEYFKKIQEREQIQDQLYVSVYESFQKGNHAQTLLLIEQTLIETPETKYKLQLEYMRVLSEGVMKDTFTFISDLDKLISQYPNSEIAERSKILVTYLKTESPEAAKAQAIKEAISIFKDYPDEEHFVAVTIPGRTNVNQLMFNIINFNIDNFSEENLKVKKTDLNSIAMLSVTSFENQKAAKVYYDRIKINPDLFRDVGVESGQVFYISETNLDRLNKDKQLEQYITFFEENIR